jgi:hypothetical protein
LTTPRRPESILQKFKLSTTDASQRSALRASAKMASDGTDELKQLANRFFQLRETLTSVRKDLVQGNPFPSP